MKILIVSGVFVFGMVAALVIRYLSQRYYQDKLKDMNEGFGKGNQYEQVPK